MAAFCRGLTGWGPLIRRKSIQNVNVLQANTNRLLTTQVEPSNDGLFTTEHTEMRRTLRKVRLVICKVELTTN